MFWYERGMGSGVILLNLLLWLCLVAGAAVMLRSWWGPRRDVGTPEQILARRHARGEIDDVEYRHRMEQLRR